MNEDLKVPSAGQVIRALRQAKELTIPQIEGKLNWSSGRLSKYENGQLAVSLPVLDDLAKALGERPERLVLLCLKERYPKLRDKRSEVARLVEKIVEELAS